MSKSKPSTINQAQYNVLSENIASGNRIAYYANLFQYTGSDAALMMAQISSSSGVIGGIAWAVNNDIQRTFPGRYPAGGITAFSDAIARQDYGMIKADTKIAGVFKVPSDLDMMKGAYSVWISNGLGKYFPGLPVLAINELAYGSKEADKVFASESKFLSTSIIPAMREMSIVTYPGSYRKSLNDCLMDNPGSRTREFNAYNMDVAEVIDKTGKSICVFKSINIEGVLRSLDSDVINFSLDYSDSLYFRLKDLLSSVDITESMNGEYAIDWTDITGTSGRDVYKTVAGSTVLDRSEVRALTADGGAVQTSIAFNPDGSFYNSQIIETAANGHAEATLAGRDIVIDLASADINLAADTTALIRGENNNVVIDDANCYAEISGSNSRITSDVAGTIIGLTGDNQTVTATGSSVWFADGTDGRVNGANNTVVANGTDVYAEINGSNTNVISTAPGNVIGLTGDNQNVFATGSAVWFGTGADGRVNGANNTVVANGTNVYAEINGSNTNVISTAPGNVIGLTGDNQNVFATGSAVWFQGGADGRVNGANNTVVANGTDVYAEINGSNTNVISTAPGNVIGLTGDNQNVSATASSVWFGAGSVGKVHGDGNTIVSNGAGILALIYGSDATAISTNIDNTFRLTGDRQTVHATKANIFFAHGTDGNIIGSSNTFYTGGTDIQMNIIGDRTLAIAWHSGNTLGFSGSDQTVHSDSNAVWMSDNTQVNLSGRGNTLVANGTNTVGYVVGDNNNFLSKAAHSSVKMSGKQLGIYGTGIRIELEPGSEAIVFGRGNSYKSDHLSKILFADEPHRNETPIGWGKVPNTVPGKFTPPVSSYDSGTGTYDYYEVRIGGHTPLTLTGSNTGYFEYIF